MGSSGWFLNNLCNLVCEYMFFNISLFNDSGNNSCNLVLH